MTLKYDWEKEIKFPHPHNSDLYKKFFVDVHLYVTEIYTLPKKKTIIELRSFICVDQSFQS